MACSSLQGQVDIMISEDEMFAVCSILQDSCMPYASFHLFLLLQGPRPETESSVGVFIAPPPLSSLPGDEIGFFVPCSSCACHTPRVGHYVIGIDIHVNMNIKLRHMENIMFISLHNVRFFFYKQGPTKVFFMQLKKILSRTYTN